MCSFDSLNCNSAKDATTCKWNTLIPTNQRKIGDIIGMSRCGETEYYKEVINKQSPECSAFVCFLSFVFVFAFAGATLIFCFVYLIVSMIHLKKHLKKMTK